MNMVDFAIIGLIALSVLWGLYRGFIQSVLSSGACILSFVLSFMLYPTVAGWFQGDQSIVMNLFHYTADAAVRVGGDLASINVTQLTGETISRVIENAKLPAPLGTLLQHNLENKVFSAFNIQSVSDYVNQTILTFSINVLSFLICFAVIFIVLSIVINLLRAVFHYPLLKQFDWLLGGAFGALRGIILCYAGFVIMPFIVTIIPFEGFNTLIAQSNLAKIFSNGNLIMSIMNRRLF